MKNVIILGASGNIARHVIDILVKNDDISLTLFLRSKSRLRNKNTPECRIIEGNVLDSNQLKEAITGQDIVYANLSGDLEAMAKNIVKAMDQNGVKRLIFICSIGIYDVLVRTVLKPYRKAADVHIADITMTMIQYILLTMQYRFDTYETKWGVFKHVSEQTIQYRLSERFWGLFIELLTVIEKLFDGIDEMELIEKIMSDDETFEIMCRILPIKAQSQTAA